MTDQICLLREKLHSLLETKPPIDIEVVKLSQELDQLIVDYNQVENFTKLEYEEGWFFYGIGI